MKNSGATLVRGMRKILAGMNNVDSYIDDLIIHINDWQAHLQVLEELLRRLREAGLRVKPSKCVFGATLMQQHDEKLYPVAYASKKLAPAETKYSTIEKECLGIVWGITKFRLYLAGKPFILQTDHQPLAYINKTKYQNDRIMRWALALQGYDYTVQDIPGKDNVAADYLSRVMD